jgi:hypothetical protein
LRQANTAVFQLQGFSGTGTSAASVESFITSQNTGTANVQTSGAGTTVNYTTGTCTTPAPLLAGSTGAKSIGSIATDIASVKSSQSVLSETTGRLSDADLCVIVDAAVQRWAAAGLGKDQIAALSLINFRVSDLPGSYLAESSSGLVNVDADAAGHGWFIDPSPLDDREFGSGTFSTGLRANLAEASAGRIDLLTTVMHEMGHALGVSDTYFAGENCSIMYGLLSEGVRRLPVSGQAEGAVAGSVSGTHFLATTVNLSIGTLAASETVTIKIRVAINDPLPAGVCQITNQATVTADGGISVTTNPTATSVDAQPPTITCPANIVANTDAGQCSKSNVTFSVTTTDNCTATPGIVCVPPSGSTFPKGVSTVTCVATDDGGNTNSCSFTVTVSDAQPPSITCPRTSWLRRTVARAARPM